MTRTYLVFTREASLQAHLSWWPGSLAKRPARRAALADTSPSSRSPARRSLAPARPSLSLSFSPRADVWAPRAVAVRLAPVPAPWPVHDALIRAQPHYFQPL
ncbi:hypothetical protein GCM10010121_013820 [Streptomyces brasiliensis]|uniref:Uncharacterized protein n=1 Tax=Streptomyces brasiliensis TaxID=1954 RepID=A0A917NJ75_9ACTN|nr:hypothetical protein GCM10010121_013820 [Streptomyces brasiliensis]